ncbi:non-lysosomal glucosylceramidase [Seonamhaeicola sp. MEBiC1930]|uniref:GH116 family glycosyl-hydrolase n=1 Tax=Seonamhaeicola sp. MEBiC01930 TaxID=2976768 RepID=UPI0032531C8E
MGIKFRIFLFAVMLVFTINAQKTKGYQSEDWPVLTTYDVNHLAKIAMPIGGIGTGTVSLGGRGDLRDWEIMNTAAKGYIPTSEKLRYIGPFFALHTQTADGKKDTRVLEGPLDFSLYEGAFGSPKVNHGFPRFETCSFMAAYPFGQVLLSDKKVPLEVRIKAFNPFIPGDVNASGIPMAAITYELTNTTDKAIFASVCGNMPNFIGEDGSVREPKGRGEALIPVGAKENQNVFRKEKNAQGIFMSSKGVAKDFEAWGTMAMTTSSNENVTYRTSWGKEVWGNSRLDFWDDYSIDGRLENREHNGEDRPMASMAVELSVPASTSREVTFYITWHFPNRKTWTPAEDGISNMLTNYYTTQYKDAWDVVEKTMQQLPSLESKTKEFVNAFVNSDLPKVVKEAALYNTSTLRTQTCFRTADGNFYGWEGTSDNKGVCHGNCTHVWNYDQATPFLFGELSRSMREIEFAHATDDKGMMSFRVNLPLERANEFSRPAADGQLGAIMKMYRDWQMSGDNELLEKLWPKVKKAMEFCWIEGGWDPNMDGIIDGCQHNTMDVQYFGPNPQMGIWYLGALKAASKMADFSGDKKFAKTCTKLFKKGSKWIDENLFNGEYYVHHIEPPKSRDDIAAPLLKGLESKDLGSLDYQLGKGCLVDQLVGQFMAHICDLGYLTNQENIKTTLNSIMKYNLREDSSSGFNSMRSFVLGDEKSLVMASYPKERPLYPFPYFTEAMTGFEYTAAIGMMYEGQVENGLTNIKNIRDRYNGLKRNPFNEAECGNNYARAMASWGAVVALSGFHYSAVEKRMQFTSASGNYFWSNGNQYGTVVIENQGNDRLVKLTVLNGEVSLESLQLKGFGNTSFKNEKVLRQGEVQEFLIKRK